MIVLCTWSDRENWGRWEAGTGLSSLLIFTAITKHSTRPNILEAVFKNRFVTLVVLTRHGSIWGRRQLCRNKRNDNGYEGNQLVNSWLFSWTKILLFKVFGGLLMGCIHSKQLLNEEDLDYIARNTAMDKAAVEVRIQWTLTRSHVMEICNVLLSSSLEYL